MHGWSKAIREAEMEILYAFEVMSTVALICVVFIFVHVYSSIIMKSGRIRRKLKTQGIKGPPPSFLYGNLPEMQKIQLQITKSPTSHHPNFIAHDYTATLFPYLEHWRKQYGKINTYTTGTGQHLYVNEAQVVKEMNQSMSLDLGKPSYVTRRLAPMLGNGIIRSNGLTWAHQRKLVAPEFYMDKVKGMMGLMVESVKPMLRKWEESIEFQGGMTAEIKVDEDLREVSADVISRACFGSSSFRGKNIFFKLRRLQKLISNQSILFEVTHLGYFASLTSLASLISQYLPLKKQNEIENLEAEIESLIWETVRERERECQETCTPEKDLMQYILEGAINDKSLSRDSSKNFIVDNCKSVYFAGHESTAVAASWCLVLLALRPEWQARIRAELAQVCQDASPTAVGSFLNLKTVTMVIQETLRLYPPAAFVSREALEETRIGNILVPKGVCIWTLIPTLYRDPEIRGPNANEFKPERFSEGVIKACKFPQAYIPFGVGLRLCLGKNFAMVQLKVVLALIVSKFTLCLSPKCQHSPAYRMIVELGHGVHILVQKIK